MAISASASFTMLPNGVSQDGRLRISVFVAPYKPGGEAWPSDVSSTVWKNWPAWVREQKFQVKWETGVADATLDVVPPNVGVRFDTQLWEQLVASSTPFEDAPTRSFVDAGLVSYDARETSQQIKSLYRAAAADTSVPSIVRNGGSQLSKTVAALATANGQKSNLKSRLINPTGATRLSKAFVPIVLPTLPLTTPEGKLAIESLRAKVMYEGKDETQRDSGQPKFAEKRATLTQILAGLGSHPWLMRRLGIVFDLLVPPIDFVRNGSAVHDLQLKSFMLGGVMVPCPITRCVDFGNDFQAFTNDARLSPRGYLNPQVHHLEQLDVDHALVEVGAYAERTATKLALSENGVVEAGLPALQTVGFSVHELNREQNTGTRFTRDETLRSNLGGAVFVMGELLRGYRVDVKRNNEPWRSLCERLDSVKIGQTILAPEQADEGHVSSGTVSVSQEDPDLVRLAESLFHWNGWSLAVQRPGKALKTDTKNVDKPTELIAPVSKATADMQVPMSSRAVVKPGSLPRLRFGDQYQVRMRLVDLAGNDLGRTGRDGQEFAMPPTPEKFLRYEPICSPTLVLKHQVSEGESVERLVIRSDPWGPTPQSPLQYASTHTPSVGGSYRANCVRHVAPPKVAYNLAEMHGKFDAIQKSNPQRAYEIARKEDGTFVDDFVTDTTTSAYHSVATDREIITPAGARRDDGTLATPYGKGPLPKRGEALAHGQYVIHTKPSHQIILPYLPDPNAKSLVLTGFGAARTRQFQPRTGADWPEIGVLALELRGALEGAPVTITGDGTQSASTALSVSVPPAGILHLQYSCAAESGDVFALCDTELAKQAARDGRSSMTTPSRKISFIHAVQRPKPPELSEGSLSTPNRAAGTTRQVVRGSILVHPPSTDHVDIVATWPEQADAGKNLDDEPGVPTLQSGIVTSVRVSSNEPLLDLPFDGGQGFGDTKRRDVKYQAVATTRFREYFSPEVWRDASSITSRSAQVKRTILSTRRPPVPKVVCVIPTFKWTTSTSGSTTVQKRIGRGLRVYVRRPWFMSGNDERLGMVLGKDEAAIVAKPQYLSIWGDDPIWFDRGKLNPLTRSQLVPPTITPIPDVEMGPAVLTDLRLPETNTLVDVVTAEPVFNKERDLWYFDFEFESIDTYFPFVRLSLARVQYKSIADCVLSEVVRADFAQLVADRSLSVVKNVNGSLGITVAGIVGANDVWSAQSSSTLAKRAAPEAAKGHLVEAQLQTTLNARKDALDWANVGLPVPLAAQIAPANSGRASLTFEGTLTPDPNRQKNAGYRILVKEYETYGGDANKRLVYSGTYELTDN